MPDLPRTQVPRVEIRARLTKDLYDRLQGECAHCGCALNAIVTLAISREIQLRTRRRAEVEKNREVPGQLKIESIADA
jgi:hypothetical protein